MGTVGGLVIPGLLPHGIKQVLLQLMSVVRLRHAPGPKTSAKQNRCLPAGRTDTCMLLNCNFNNPNQSQR